jgi:hypothetical protein
VPAGISAWTPANDSDPHILSIAMSHDGSNAAQRNGLLGTFTDDNGDDVSMIQNLNHGHNISHTVSSARTTFEIQFDSSVNRLTRLDRVTGQHVIVPLTNNRLVIAIPAGTGELFKYVGSFMTEAGLPGDYNSDGSVDAADYVAWRKTGVNGQLGYDTWRANFGKLSPEGGSNLVPEPYGLGIVSMFLATMIATVTNRRT